MKRDDSRAQDYDPPDAEWVDISYLGGAYELQVDVRRGNNQRHRKLCEIGPWIKGPEPKPDRRLAR